MGVAATALRSEWVVLMLLCAGYAGSLGLWVYCLRVVGREPTTTCRILTTVGLSLGIAGMTPSLMLAIRAPHLWDYIFCFGPVVCGIAALLQMTVGVIARRNSV
jgi:hypothetical protein